MRVVGAENRPRGHTSSGSAACAAVLAAVSLTASLLNLFGALASGGCILMFSPEAAHITALGATTGIILGRSSRTRLGTLALSVCITALLLALCSFAILVVTPIGYPGGTR
jgi:hypothetical protein